jgi:hypothetical protein
MPPGILIEPDGMTLARTREATLHLRECDCPVSAAGSNGRCNTIQCVDSSMFPWTNPSVWPYSIKNTARAAFLLT